MALRCLQPTSLGPLKEEFASFVVLCALISFCNTGELTKFAHLIFSCLSSPQGLGSLLSFPPLHKSSFSSCGTAVLSCSSPTFFLSSLPAFPCLPQSCQRTYSSPHMAFQPLVVTPISIKQCLNASGVRPSPSTTTDSQAAVEGRPVQ